MPRNNRKWTTMLLAILLGNLVYLFLYRYLPQTLAHRTFRLDSGLIFDFAICAGLYVLLRKVF